MVKSVYTVSLLDSSKMSDQELIERKREEYKLAIMQLHKRKY